jgi:hypothetical protein
MTRQRGLFDEIDPAPVRSPVRTLPALAYRFYRQHIGGPLAERGATYEAHGFQLRGHPVETDWLVMAHVLLGDTVIGRDDRERVTVMVGGLTGDVSFSVTRADGAARVTEAVAGRFLILAHSRNGLDVSARLIEGDELGLCTRRWITTVSSFFRAGGRRPVRLSTPWDRISAQGERVLSVRGGDLIYPQTGDRITHSQRGTVPC